MRYMKKLRKIASNQIILENGSQLTLSIVEILNGVVQKYYPLTHEMPYTEWLGGQVFLKREDDGALRAYYNNKVLYKSNVSMVKE